eukprot:738417-Rhodomonas_salina.2
MVGDAPGPSPIAWSNAGSVVESFRVAIISADLAAPMIVSIITAGLGSSAFNTIVDAGRTGSIKPVGVGNKQCRCPGPSTDIQPDRRSYPWSINSLALEHRQ